jgi:hypothetical protein
MSACLVARASACSRGFGLGLLYDFFRIRKTTFRKASRAGDRRPARRLFAKEGNSEVVDSTHGHPGYRMDESGSDDGRGRPGNSSGDRSWRSGCRCGKPCSHGRSSQKIFRRRADRSAKITSRPRTGLWGGQSCPQPAFSRHLALIGGTEPPKRAAAATIGYPT